MARCCTLSPAMPVLLRPDGAVQVGWDPRRALLIHPPAGLTTAGLAELLRSMQARVGVDELHRRAAGLGLADAAALTDLIAALVAAGLANLGRGQPRRPRTPAIRVHGRGPLSDLLAASLRCSGARISRSHQPHARLTGADLVVLADTLVVDPHMVRDLHTGAVAHLAVRVRDGTGLVGPLVLPGVTSCLDCADLHRGDRDAAWPAMAVQLRDTVGSADRATILATAALALNQVDQVIAAVRGTPAEPDPPATLNATLEFDLATGSIVARHWPRHPRCRC
ncbi:MAG TPA: cyclodehydratase [Mycobacterium sp.]|nr:cyclodehydratase [Mycobacterium sp.]